MIPLLFVCSALKQGLYHSIRLWKLFFLLWLLNIFLLIPLVFPVFMYLRDALPDVNHNSPLTSNLHSDRWDTMNLSVIHDLTLSFSEPGMASLVKSLMYLPFLLFILGQPFLQAGLFESIEGRFNSNPISIYQLFFLGIGRRSLAYIRIGFILLLIWFIIFFLTQNFSTYIDSQTWTLAQASMLSGGAILFGALMMTLLTTIGDITRFHFSFRDNRIGNRRVWGRAIALVRRHFFPLLSIRAFVYLTGIVFSVLLLSRLHYWNLHGWRGLISILLLQQSMIFIILWSRITTLTATFAYIKTYTH